MLRRTSFWIVACMVLSGCSSPWNAAHTGLELTAEAVAQTDRVVASAMLPSLERARAAVVVAAREARQAHEACLDADPAREDCGEAPSIETFMVRYDELVSRWSGLGSALEVIRQLLITLEAAVTSWLELANQKRPNAS